MKIGCCLTWVRRMFALYVLLLTLKSVECTSRLNHHASHSYKPSEIQRRHHAHALLQKTSQDDTPPYENFEKLWVFRLYEAMIGTLIGGLLILFSMFLVFAIESFAVKSHMVFGIAKKICVPNISDSHVNENLDGRVVHVYGEMKVSDNSEESESDSDASSDFDLFGKDTSSSDDDFQLFETGPLSVQTNAKSEVKTVQSAIVQPAKEEAPVKTEATIAREAKDPDFNFAPKKKAVVLRRTVEMLQWKHDQRFSLPAMGNPKLEWSEPAIESADARFRNPPFPIESQSFFSKTYLGAYKLSIEQMEKLQQWQSCSLEDFDVSGVEHVARTHQFVGIKGDSTNDLNDNILNTIENPERTKKFLYFRNIESADQNAPVPTYGATELAAKAGDIRISYQMIAEGPLTVVGVLEGKTFKAFNSYDAQHTCEGVSHDIEEKGVTTNPENDRFFDMFSEFLFDSKLAKDALLVEERKAGVDDIFDGELKENSSWVSLFRLIALTCTVIGVFIILYPTAELFPYHEKMKIAVGLIVLVQSLVLGLFVWMLFVGIVWFKCEPWVLTCALGALAVILYLSGGLVDNVWWAPLWPIHFSFTLCGEILFVLTLIPLGFVAQKIHRDHEYARYVNNMDKDAGLSNSDQQA